MINPIYQGQTAIIMATGPSFTFEQVDLAHHAQEKGIKLFGCNSTWKMANLDIFHACNANYYEHFWEKGLKDHRSVKWTFLDDVATKYGVNHIPGRWADGLSTNPEYIHYHHGAGPQLINIAFLYGITRMLLIGWDMRYPPGEKRHFFGEDPLTENHFPKTGPNGEFIGLIREMATIKPEDYGIEIINCTSNSAMTCFPMMSLENALATS